MKLHDVLDDREAEPGAAEFAGARTIDAVKALGEPRDVGPRDAFAGVGDRELDALARLLARFGRARRRDWRSMMPRNRRCVSRSSTPATSVSA